MAEVGRDLIWSSGPVPLLKQRHLEVDAQDHAQVACEYLQGARFQKPSDQLLPVLSHPHNQKQFPVFKGSLHYFGLYPSTLVLALGATEESLS